MERFYPRDVDVHTLSPLALAFVGDGVYSLLVRERLLTEANRPVGDLHRLAVTAVRAEAQAEAMERLLPLLTEEEVAVFKRGRNAHSTRTGADYHKATGLESLFGYLYLDGRLERVQELFAHCMKEDV
ncbi:MAG: ribonuclease III [Ruminococcaceae bacterium]|nr:ribonuclease III [Oscillospiraceae bacterium]